MEIAVNSIIKKIWVKDVFSELKGIHYKTIKPFRVCVFRFLFYITHSNNNES